MRASGPLAALAMLLAASGASAQTLESILAERLSEAPAVQRAAQDAEAAAARVRVARARGLPQVTAGSAYQFGTGDYDPGPNGRELLADLPSGPGDALSLGGQNGGGRLSAEAAIEQPIFTGFQIRNGVRSAAAAAEAEAARAALARQRVGLAIAEGYTGLVAAQARLEAAEAAAERFGVEAQAAALRFETGRSTRTDLALAEAQDAAASGTLAAARAEVTAARAALSALIGAPPETLLPPAVPPVPETAEAALSSALSKAPAVIAAREASAAAEAALRAAKGARSPQLSARAAAQYAEDQFLTGDELTALTLTAQLRVPIFEGGAIGARISEARAAARSARFALVEAERAAEAEALSTFARYRAAALADEAAGLREDAASLAAEGAALERELGRRSLQDTLAAIQLSADARAAKADAARAHVLAAYGLRAAAGLPLVPEPDAPSD